MDFMNIIAESSKEFHSKNQGSSSYHKDTHFIQIDDKTFVPLSYLQKKDKNTFDIKNMLEHNYLVSSLEFLNLEFFSVWWQNSFNIKLTQKKKKALYILHFPDSQKITEALEIVDQVYHILRNSKVIINGKNLPIQLGEWYAKIIFGLIQRKSSSQRGFDFFTLNEKKAEVEVCWSDQTSPKGVKLKKSLIEMSDFTIIIYMAKNFMIRDILFLDSDYVIRKFSGKGHTIFLKDPDVSSYFFSKSSRHYDKILNKTAFSRFTSPSFAQSYDQNSN